MPEVTMTPETLALRELLEGCHAEFQVLLDRDGATNPELFARDDIDVFRASY